MKRLTTAQREILRAIASGEFVHLAAEHRKTGEMVMVFGNADHRFRETTVKAVETLGLIKYEYINHWMLTPEGRAMLENDHEQTI